MRLYEVGDRVLVRVLSLAELKGELGKYPLCHAYARTGNSDLRLLFESNGHDVLGSVPAMVYACEDGSVLLSEDCAPYRVRIDNHLLWLTRANLSAVVRDKQLNDVGGF